MSKKAREIAAQTKIEKLIPKQPDDLFKKALEAGFSNEHYMVFRRNGPWSREHKRYGLTGKCTACKKTVTLQFRERTPDKFPIGEEVEHHTIIFCPVCGERVVCIDRAKLQWGYAAYDTCSSIVFSKADDLVVAVTYRLDRMVTKDGEDKREICKERAYVFGKEKPIGYVYSRCYDGWRHNKMQIKYKWTYNDTISDAWQRDINVVYPFSNDLFAGTCLENAKIANYLNKTQDARLIKYCQQYLLYPGIENLVTNGFEKLVCQKISGGEYIQAAVNWRESAPSKMLGLNRPEIVQMKAERWTPEELYAYKWARDNKVPLHIEEQKDLQSIGVLRLDKAAKRARITTRQLLRYLLRQKRRAKSDMSGYYFFTIWEDYLKTAKELGYKMDSKSIVLPPDLGAAHDRAVQAKKYSIEKALIEKFAKVYQQMQPLTWEQDGLLIRPAESEKELIMEGDALDHCVGGYGKAHCAGKPIFFIRDTANPDIPYYTLQLDIKSKKIIHNLGYRNNQTWRGGAARSEKVDAFADEWIKKVVSQFNFKTGKFIKHKKHNAA